MQSQLSQWKRRRLAEEDAGADRVSVALRQGLVLQISAWPPSTIQQHMKALTFQPHSTFDAGAGAPPPSPVCCYSVEGDQLLLPRNYKGLPWASVKEELAEGAPCAFSFSATLNPLQAQALSKSLDCLAQAPYACILTLPCGFGKTVVALALLEKVGRKTLVVVHKESLMLQWRERIQAFLPGSRVGIVQQKRDDLETSDICICMLQTLCTKALDPEHLASFGLVVLDEAHHMAAQFFSRLFFRLPCKRILGLTATPKRKDGCSNVLHLFMGPFSFQLSTRSDAEVTVYSRHWRNAFQITGDVSNAQVQKLKGRVAQDAVRNGYILDLCRKALTHGRTVICLSERLKHLEVLHEAWCTSEPGAELLAAKFVGGNSRSNLAERTRAEATARVIFASSAMAAEGLDIPRLDTLILASPMGDITQAVGRILRPCSEKQPPVILDFRDDGCQAFLRLARTRLACYQRQAFRVLLDEEPEFGGSDDGGVVCVEAPA